MQGVAPRLRFVRCPLDLTAHSQLPDASAEAHSARIVRFDKLGGQQCFCRVMLPCEAASSAFCALS